MRYCSIAQEAVCAVPASLQRPASFLRLAASFAEGRFIRKDEEKRAIYSCFVINMRDQ